VNWVNGKVTYRYGNRIPESTYVPAQNEFVNLRMFDQAHRITHNPALVLNFGGKGPWLVSANYTYMSQVYDKNFFGLSNNRRGAAGLDVNYAPSDRWGVVAYYNHERIGSAYRSAAKELDPPLPASFAGNEWDRSTRDMVDSFGIGFNLLSTNQKWQFSVNYDFSLANERISTINPVVPLNPLDATGRPFPDIKSQFHEVFVDTSYAFRHNWKAGVRYIFSPYRLQDFTTDNIAPYMPTQSATAVPGTIDPQILFTPAGTSGSLKFLLLNSKYASADAHMMGVYIRYTF